MEKTITTSCSFPLIKLNTNIKYAEARKPTGVGYIILVLIKDAKIKDALIIDVLKRFGVPNDLMFMFSREIDVLLDRYILRRAGNGSPFFEELMVGNLEFTENGERMFREGAIPTGEEKSKQTDVYFNPLTGDFNLKANAHIPIERTDCYPKGFMDRVDADMSGLKDFLIDNSRDTGLQKEERLLECTINDTTFFVTKSESNMDLHIDEDGMEISFKTPGAGEFYEKYFTPDMIERELAAKTKFKFGVPSVKVTGLVDFKNLSAVQIPEEYSKQSAYPSKLNLTRKDEKITVLNGKDTITFDSNKIASAISESFSDGWSFVLIDDGVMRIYTAANVDMMERTLGKPIGINILVEQKFGADDTNNVLNTVLSECNAAEYSDDHAKLVRAISQLTRNARSAADYIASKLSAANVVLDGAKQAKILVSANTFFKDVQGWQDAAVKHASTIYESLIAGMTKDNVAYTVGMTKTLDAIRKPGKDELLHTVAKKFRNLDEISLFNILTDAKFTETEALSIANIISIYVQKILAGDTALAKSSVSDNFIAIANDLKDLKSNLGIESTLKYLFREGYDIEKFLSVFKAFKNKLAALKKYEVFARDGFAELKRYEEIIQPVFDYIMIERNASASPEKITESYIKSKINSGEYRTAVGDMTIRLEHTLGKILGAGKDIDLLDRIKLAKDKGVLTDDDVTSLHELRKFRNNIQHPTEEKLTFDKAKITKWTDTVFSIKEKTAEKKK